jgi:hypothetical protein
MCTSFVQSKYTYYDLQQFVVCDGDIYLKE